MSDEHDSRYTPVNNDLGVVSEVLVGSADFSEAQAGNTSMGRVESGIALASIGSVLIVTGLAMGTEPTPEQIEASEKALRELKTQRELQQQRAAEEAERWAKLKEYLDRQSGS